MTTDEIKIRLTAFFVLLLAIGYILIGSVAIPLLLAADFALRSFNMGRRSPLFRLSAGISRLVNWSGKPVYLPAKRFAARIGLLISALMAAFALTGSWVAPGLAILLAVFAALESLAGICAGCYVYDLLQNTRS